MYPTSNIKIGDLVLFLQTIEWEGVVAVEGEIGIVVEIFEPNDDINYFDLNIQLGGGARIQVWEPEIELLEDET